MNRCFHALLAATCCRCVATVVQLSVTPQTAVVGQSSQLVFTSTQSSRLPRVTNPVYTAILYDVINGRSSAELSCNARASGFACEYTFPLESSFSATLRDNLGIIDTVTILAFIQPSALYVSPSKYSLAGADFFTIKLDILELPVLESPKVIFKVASIILGNAIDATVVQQGGYTYLSGRSPPMGSEDISGIEVHYTLNGVQFSRAAAKDDAVITASHQKPYKIGFIYHQAFSMTNGWIYQQNLARLSLYSVFGSRIETLVSENKPDKGQSQCPDVCDGPDGWCTKMDGCAGKGLSHFCYVEGKRLIEEENVDMVVGVTFWYWPDLVQLSKEYPNKKFLSTAPGSPAHLTSNFARGWLRRYQAHYMMGFVLGHLPVVQKNRRVGYVASFSGASKIAFGAFMKGLQEASGYSDFRLYVTYTLSWGSARRERIATERFFKYYNVSAVGTICNSFEPYYVARNSGGFSTGNNLDAMQAVGPSVVSSALFSWELQLQLYVGTAMAGIPWGNVAMNDTGATSPPLYSWYGRDKHGFSMAPFSTEVPPEAQSIIKAREAEFASGHDDIWCGTLRKPGKATVNTSILGSEIAAGECMGSSPSVGFIAGWESIGIQDACVDESEKINGKCYIGVMDTANDVPDECAAGKGLFTEGCVDCPIGKFSESDECIFCSPGKYSNITGLAACHQTPQQGTSEQKYIIIGGMNQPPTQFVRASVGIQSCEEICTTDAKCVGFLIHKDAAIGSCWSVQNINLQVLVNNDSASYIDNKYIFHWRAPITGYVPMPCPQGTFGFNFSGSQCTDCGTICEQCGKGKYADQRGMFECISCGGDLTTESGASLSQSYCLCAAGYYRSEVDRLRCLPCKEGMFCDWGSDAKASAHFPVLQSGYWSDRTEPLDVFQCKDEKRCVGGNPLLDEICAPNIENERACEKCRAGYTWNGDECKECTGYQKTWLFFPMLAIVAAPIIITVLYKLFGDTYERWGSWKNGIASIGFIVLNLYQTISLTPNVNMLPPEHLANLLSSFGWTADATIFFTIECTGYGSFKSKVILRAIGPACVALAYFLVWWLSQRIATPLSHYFSKLPDVRMDRNRTLNGFFSIIFTFFAGISSTVLKTFMCTPNPNGLRTLSIDRSVVCHQGEWKSMVIVAVIAAAFWILGFLSIFIWVICRFKKKFYNPKWQMRWKFLFIKFRPDVYWWAIPVLAKGVLVNVGLIAIDSAVGQINWLLVCTIIYLNVAIAYRPWRHVFVNVIDIGAQECLILVCSALMFFVSLDAKTKPEVIKDHMQIVTTVFVFLLLPTTIPVALHLWWSETSKSAVDSMRSQAPLIQEACMTIVKSDPEKFERSISSLSEWDRRHLMQTQQLISGDFYKDFWQSLRKSKNSSADTGSPTNSKAISFHSIPKHNYVFCSESAPSERESRPSSAQNSSIRKASSAQESGVSSIQIMSLPLSTTSSTNDWADAPSDPIQPEHTVQSITKAESQSTKASVIGQRSSLRQSRGLKVDL